MRSYTDEELVNSYLETRENDYFELLYERYCDKVHRKCLSFTKDSVQAQDLTQDIFLRLIMKLDGYKRQAKFSTWLYSITHNYCTDQVRLPRRRQEMFVTDDWDGLPIQATEDNSAELEEQEARLIQQAMMQLDPQEQLLLRQKYQDDVSIRDLAGAHALTESAVKMRLKRSRDRLRSFYWQAAVD